MLSSLVMMTSLRFLFHTYSSHNKILSLKTLLTELHEDACLQSNLVAGENDSSQATGVSSSSFEEIFAVAAVAN